MFCWFIFTSVPRCEPCCWNISSTLSPKWTNLTWWHIPAPWYLHLGYHSYRSVVVVLAILMVNCRNGRGEAVAQVLGPDFALWGCQIFCKPGARPTWIFVWGWWDSIHFGDVNNTWLVVWNMFYFSILGHIGNNHPYWLIFFRGVQTTNQI